MLKLRSSALIRKIRGQVVEATDRGGTGIIDRQSGNRMGKLIDDD